MAVSLTNKGFFRNEGSSANGCYVQLVGNAKAVHLLAVVADANSSSQTFPTPAGWTKVNEYSPTLWGPQITLFKKYGETSNSQLLIGPPSSNNWFGAYYIHVEGCLATDPPGYVDYFGATSGTSNSLTGSRPAGGMLFSIAAWEGVRNMLIDSSGSCYQVSEGTTPWVFPGPSTNSTGAASSMGWTIETGITGNTHTWLAQGGYSADNTGMMWVFTQGGPSFNRDGIEGTDIASVDGVDAGDIANVDGIDA